MNKLRNTLGKTLGAAILAGTCLSAPAHAGNFYAFGDSLVDNGNTPKFGIAFPPPPYSDFRFSNGPVWAQYFPGLTGLGFQPSNDYAVGGAFAGPLTILGTTYNNLENLPPALGEPGFPVQLPSFLQQVGEFQAGGGRLGASDVVGIWVGANDYFATLALVQAGLANATTAITNAVQTVALQTTAGVNELVNLGGRRFIVFNLPALGETPLFNQDGAATIAEANAISAAHNSTLAQFMAGEHGSTGANIIVMNEAQIFSELLADPAAYGKTNTTAACITTPSCVTASTAVQNQYVFWDSVHPTTGTHLLIAKYAADALNGLAGLAVPAQVEALGAKAFAGQLNQRLDALRAGAAGFSFNLPDQGMQGSVGSGDAKLSGFFSGAYDFGSRNTLGADNGFSYTLGSFAAGLDDRLAPGIAAGVALGYATEHGNVSQDGTVAANAYQLGAYASFYQPDYYLNIDFAYGIDNFTNSRPGVVGGAITSKPSGATTQFGGETGYVWHRGALAFGPIAGIDITNAGLHAYTETGDAALTQSVASQNFEQVVGDVGASVSTSLTAGRLTLAPHLVITADRRFTGNGGSFSSVFTDEPGVGLTTTYPNTSNTWAEISGGVAARLARNVSLSADFASSIAETGGADHAVSGSLHVSF
jgi:outer membrane lipase/esterase